MMQERIREMLEDLEAVRENLLALSDEFWQSIQHNDPEALEEGVQFKRAYNEKLAAFERLADRQRGQARFTLIKREKVPVPFLCLAGLSRLVGARTTNGGTPGRGCPW